MEYVVLKALHIISVVAWFAALLYIVRLFIYHVEAKDKPATEGKAIQDQLLIMMRRLLKGIMTPAMVLSLGFGIAIIVVNPGSVTYKKEVPVENAASTVKAAGDATAGAAVDATAAAEAAPATRLKTKLQPWFHLKATLLLLLFGYHGWCSKMFKKLRDGKPTMGSKGLRIMNEVGTLFLIFIVSAAVIKYIPTILTFYGITAALFAVIFIIMAKRKPAGGAAGEK